MSRGPRRPKPPPSSRSCSLTLSRGDAEHLGGRLLRVGLALGADPDFGGIARGRNRCDRIQRLHLGVVGVVAEKLGFQGGRRFGQLSAGVAGLEPVAAIDLGIARRRDEGIDALIAAEAPGPAVLGPAHAVGDRAPSRECSPRSLGDDADAMRQLDGLDDARDRFDLGFVDFFRPGALDRRAQHGAVEHARHLNVDAVRARCR